MYRYRVNGQRYKMVLGRYPDLSLKAAHTERDTLATRVAKGESPVEEKKLVRFGLATNPTVMDNLSSHKVQGVRERIQAAGADLLYLPPYSPDLNPIEKAW